LTGLRQELPLFTALPPHQHLLLDIAWLAILAAAVWQFVRSIRSGNAIAASVAASPILLTGILALLALIQRYPFGGELRHQYVLFPFLLLLLALVLDSLWRRINSRSAQIIIAGILVALMLNASYRTLQWRTMLGEAPAAPLWSDEFQILFEDGGEIPVFIPHYTFYSAFMDRWVNGIQYQDSYRCSDTKCTQSTQGWRALIEPRPDFQQYRIYVNGGKDITLLSYLWWTFPVLPNDEFFKRIKGSLQTIGASSGRIFSQSNDPDRAQMETELRQRAQAHGLSLEEYRVSPSGVIWSVRIADTATTPTATASQ